MNNVLTTREGYSMQKEAFAVLWFAYAGDGERAIRELVPVEGMSRATRSRLLHKLEIDPYVRHRIAELQGVAAERALDDAQYLKDQLQGVVEDARIDGKHAAAAQALAQYARIVGLDGVQRVDVTSGGASINITRTIIDPKVTE